MCTGKTGHAEVIQITHDPAKVKLDQLFEVVTQLNLGRQHVEDLEQLLYYESGLLGVSGISSDVEQLLASGAPEAREALELFAFQVARHAGALAATLGGLDRFVFTGGIGEHAAAVRAMIVDRMELFGARLDERANEAGEKRLSSDASQILIERRPAQEELGIARDACELLACSTVAAGAPPAS